MADLVFDLSGLADADRAVVAAHFRQTYGLNWGSAERADAMYFRCNVSECLDRSPVAAVVRDLLEQMQSGSTRIRLRTGALDAYGAIGLSEVLRQTERRVQRDTLRDDGLTSAPADALTAMRKHFERRCGVPDDGETRRAFLAWPADPAARERIKAAEQSRAEARRAAVRRQEQPRVLPREVGGGDAGDTFQVAAPAAREFFPARGA
jgi:hypothetical protein